MHKLNHAGIGWHIASEDDTPCERISAFFIGSLCLILNLWLSMCDSHNMNVVSYSCVCNKTPRDLKSSLRIAHLKEQCPFLA